MVDEFNIDSSGSSSLARGGGKKHEINAATFGGHLFYDILLCPPHRPPGSATDRVGPAAFTKYVTVSCLAGPSS